ncbi:MAG: hypothetical protein LC792_19405 [Actinobacteria bacterium]|nr:hypothetical protein [Actinomycetota bacterium]
MAEHRSAVTGIAASSVHRRRRWLIGAVGALGASALVLGGPGVPAFDGSPAGEVVGVLTAALERGLPGDGDGSLPGNPTGLPGELDGVVPNEPGGSGPGEPGGPGDRLPADLGDVVPGGLVPDGSGTDRGGLLDRLAQVLPMAIDDGGPGGNIGGPSGNGAAAPAVNTAAAGSRAGSPAASGAGPERGAPSDTALDGESDHGAPALVANPVPAGATLPRTGGGLGNGVLRLIAFLGLGRAVIPAHRRPGPVPPAGGAGVE